MYVRACVRAFEHVCVFGVYTDASQVLVASL